MTFTLHNGVKMPSIGLGTWLIEPEGFEELIPLALDTGYRMFDSAQAYETERELGQALASHPREELWITSKVWNDSHGYFETLDAFDSTLERLNTSYLDCYMIHWPCPQLNKWQESWVALEDLLRTGRTRTIGVSNFDTQQLNELLALCKVKPHILQTELHPLWQQQELRQLCNEHIIHVQASRPLAHGALNECAELEGIAHEHNVSVQELAIAWTLAHGCSLVPKASSAERLRANIARAQYALDSSVVNEVDALEDVFQLQTGDCPMTMHRGCSFD